MSTNKLKWTIQNINGGGGSGTVSGGSIGGTGVIGGLIQPSVAIKTNVRTSSTGRPF